MSLSFRAWLRLRHPDATPLPWQVEFMEMVDRGTMSFVGNPRMGRRQMHKWYTEWWDKPPEPKKERGE